MKLQERMMKCVHGLLLLCFCNLALAASDQEEIKDHPVVSRYPGSVIYTQIVSDFDAYSISLSAPTASDSNFSEVRKLELEGKLTRTSYQMPPNASLLAIYRSYEQALIKGGFQLLFSCKKENCGSGSYWGKLHLGTAASFDTHQYYLAAKKSAGQSNIYVVMHTSQNGDGGFISTQVDVLEEKALEKDLVKTSSVSLEQAINDSGKALVYDIYFDTGKAELKPESQAAMESIAQLLKTSPKLKLFVVGHTDGVGGLAANLDLSKRRADAVVATLTTRFGVAKERLIAQGVGPLAPVATNQDDRGREKNRRVELVQML